MNRSRFIEKYKITENSPVSASDSVVSVSDFINETNKFLTSNFEGLFKINSQTAQREHIRLPLDYIIYFFKLMAINVHAESLINVNCSCKNNDFVIKINAECNLEIDDLQMREMIKTARNAGFSVVKTADGFILTKALLTSDALAVFTKIVITTNAIAKRFWNIFFGK